MIFEFLSKYATLLIVCITAVFVGLSNFKKNNNTIDDRLIVNYEKLDKQQKEQLAEKDEQIAKYQTDMAEVKVAMANLKENFAKETGKLQGQLDAKDKELASLRAIILDPSLNLGKILTEIHGFMAELTKANKQQVDILQGQTRREKIIDNRDVNLKSGREE